MTPKVAIIIVLSSFGAAGVLHSLSSRGRRVAYSRGVLSLHPAVRYSYNLVLEEAVVPEDAQQWAVVDLFSGAGGMSYGFYAHPDFRIVSAADAQMGKPSSGHGTLGCNATYQANIGVTPIERDLAKVDPSEVCQAMGIDNTNITVLSACPPCTGFSRTLAHNHLRDDVRNGLVGKVADYVKLLRPEIVLMENARELVMGRFSEHLQGLRSQLSDLGYNTLAGTHFLNEFGLPQKRERAVVIAVRNSLPLLGLEDLWKGYIIDQKATHVRRAIWELPPVEAGEVATGDPMHAAPVLRSDATRRRMAATPHDGGGWVDLVDHPKANELLIPSMKSRAAIRDFGSHPDVYGRLWWDRPAVTIKRECGHIGNGRYAHPEQDRLCTVREMSILQGFPRNFTFTGTLTNRYRHIGDAVPPLISYQLAALSKWIITGERPTPEQMILPGCHLKVDDVEAVAAADARLD
jgi:DNA (cytosine-5)-methyltransferase 1